MSFDPLDSPIVKSIMYRSVVRHYVQKQEVEPVRRVYFCLFRRKIWMHDKYLSDHECSMRRSIPPI